MNDLLRQKPFYHELYKYKMESLRSIKRFKIREGKSTRDCY